MNFIYFSIFPFFQLDDNIEDNFKYQIDIDFKKDNNFEKELEVLGEQDNAIKESVLDDVFNSIEAKKNDFKIDNLDETSRKILEKRSQVLRLYLIEHVIPILSEGILKVSHELPEDPVVEIQKFLEEKAEIWGKKKDENE